MRSWGGENFKGVDVGDVMECLVGFYEVSSVPSVFQGGETELLQPFGVGEVSELGEDFCGTCLDPFKLGFVLH